MTRLSCAGGRVEIIVGDCRESMRAMNAGSAACCVTSPPYFGLRDYGHAEQIGLEDTPSAYVEALVDVFREVRRVLADDGTLWVNLGDSYAGSWGAQSRGGPPSEKSTLAGNGHVGGGPKLGGLSAVQIASHPRRDGQTGTIREPGVKPKDLYGMPWRVAFALQADGWYLRQDIIWHKPNPMPESVRDRCTKAHEYLFLLSKSPRYYYDQEAVKEPATNRPPGSKASNKHIAAALTDPKARTKANLHKIESVEDRNRRSVWTVATEPFSGAHFAVYPPRLIEPCILAGSPRGGLVLDPFGGAGTTGLVAARHGRRAVLCELNPEYAEIASRRIALEWREPVRVTEPAEHLPLFGASPC